MHTPKKSFDSHFLKPPKSGGSIPASPHSEDSGRFIPNRGSSNFKELFAKTDHRDSPLPFSNMVHQELFGSPEDTQHSVLQYHTQSNYKADKENMPIPPLFQLESSSFTSPRNLPKNPYKILDAPELKDDFYVDLLSWSSQNLLAVALNKKVYLWNSNTSEINEISELRGRDSFTSIKWSESGTHLATGSEGGFLRIFDIAYNKIILERDIGHGKTGCLAWNSNMLSTGCNDGYIVHSDLRALSLSAQIKGHRQEVCGLQWSYDGQYLASGGNDNRLNIWSSLNHHPTGVLKGHSAAVKALGWDPHHSDMLASGGGSNDKTVRIWDIVSMTEVARADSQSQVCNLAYSKNSHELVTAHGYRQNSVIVWKMPTLEQVGMLSGHSKRVLFLEISPDGENVVTGGADETLRFWSLFPKIEETHSESSLLSISMENIR